MKLIINIDGAARGNPGPAGYGIAVFNEDGTVLDEAFGYLGEQTNNVAEYCALIAALDLAHFKKWDDLLIRSDSQLMVKQLQGEYKVKNTTLKELYNTVLTKRRRLKKVKLEHVRRKFNKEADALANKAVDTEESTPNFINPLLDKPVKSGENFNMEF